MAIVYAVQLSQVPTDEHSAKLEWICDTLEHAKEVIQMLNRNTDIFNLSKWVTVSNHTLTTHYSTATLTLFGETIVNYWLITEWDTELWQKQFKGRR